MTGTTSVPDVQFTAAGLVLPDESAILAGVNADLNAAFGGGLNPALNTPQGQFASTLTAAIGDKNNLFAQYVNQVNPDFADGRMQDAIARIYFLDRNPALSTVLQIVCNGAAGVVIPAGSLVADGNGAIYSSTLAGTIPAGGNITLPFAATVAGPVAVPATVSIYKSVIGWDSASVDSGTIGQSVESRSDFEYRRKQSVALNGRGSLPAIYANVFDVAGVLDVYVSENTTSAPITIGSTSYSLAAHSIYVAAVGGASADIADAIWRIKDCGADYNGNTSITVTDQSGYSIPYPTYTVKYEIPAAQPILFDVQIANNSALPSDIVARVKAAIMAAFSGADGGQRARIGATIYASRYYAPVGAIGPSVSILSLLIGTSTATLASVTVGIDKAPTVTESNITVTLV